MIWEFGWFGVAFVIVALVFAASRILREYERGVVFTLGRFWKVKGPGLIVIIPGIQQMVRVDLRTRVMDVPSQDVISRDNVSVEVKALGAGRGRGAKGPPAGGDLQAPEKLRQPGEVLAASPQAMQLRYLQTLTAIAG